MTGEALLLEVPLLQLQGILNLRDLRKSSGCKGLQPAIIKQPIIYGVRAAFLLINRIDLPIIDIDEPRTEEVIGLKIHTLDDIAGNQRLEIVIDHRGDSLEGGDVVYEEDLE